MGGKLRFLDRPYPTDLVYMLLRTGPKMPTSFFCIFPTKVTTEICKGDHVRLDLPCISGNK